MGLERVFEETPAAFVPYLAVGDPSLEASREHVEALDRGGADVIELGLPFSEPIAEGPTIQAAINRALEAGVTPERYFEFVESLTVEAPLVCMTYYNLIYQYRPPETADVQAGQAPEPFVARAAEAGIEGIVVPDLPAEEAGPLREACEAHGLDLVFIVAPTTRGERLERIREQVSGYVYVQARVGTTGAREDVSDHTRASLERLTDWEVPKAVGFGISTGEQAERIVAAGADGIIVGSALVGIVAEGHEEGRPTHDVAQQLTDKTRELKAGALAGTERPSRSDTDRPGHPTEPETKNSPTTE